MELAYWVVAALLAAFYLYAGGKKVAQSQEQLQPMMGWVDTIPMSGVLEQGFEKLRAGRKMKLLVDPTV